MATKIDCTTHRQILQERVDAAKRLVEATKSQALPMAPSTPKDVSREARGLAVLLLFAAYENLLNNLCRTLLERAAKSRAKAASLKPGIRLFLVHGELAGLLDSGRKKLWKPSGLRIVNALASRPAAELNMDLFPDDGSYMKSTQVELFCEIFDFGHPGPVLRDVWARLDTIVDQRNSIAHGRKPPEEVGRTYSHNEILSLISTWEKRWLAFIDWIETHCSSTNFYLNR